MRQILQNLRSGELELAEVPAPGAGRGMVLIQTRASVISPGTERMLVEFSQANLLGKARQQPDRVRQVLDKMRTDGLLPTLEAVFRKLDEPLPLGYSNAGVVLEVGSGVTDLRPGDRVLSNGPHAEIVAVPRNLCARIPEGVSDEDAAFGVLGSVALQGIRLAEPTLGETFVVFGMGLLGLLTVQLLRASGCHVIAADPKPERLLLAEQLGAQIVDVARGADPVTAARAATGGAGADGVLITASADTHEIVHEAAVACRKRGRIILVGVVGLNLRRADFFEKELRFQVSCSYGPGRYDESYEQGGQDYPQGFVRWTEQRNFEAVLGAMADGSLDVAPLVSNRLAFDAALAAYEAVQGDALGVVLEYAERIAPENTIQVRSVTPATAGELRVGVIGAGSFATGVILPALAKTQARLAWVATKTNAAAARHAAQRFGIDRATTDYSEILSDPDVDCVFILVRHNQHARMAAEALAAGKHVFVEKPLALGETELEELAKALAAAPEKQLMVGFNRRFSPHARKVAELVAARSEPLAMTMTVNGGAIPPDSWLHDPAVGGGRVIGEGCHFLDLLSFVAGSPIAKISAVQMGANAAQPDDKISVSIGFADGSVGTLDYFSNGTARYPKETLTVFSEGRVVRLDNFRRTTGYGFRGFKRFRTFRQDKGHKVEVEEFIARVRAGGAALIPFDQLENVTRASFAAVASAREDRTILL